MPAPVSGWPHWREENEYAALLKAGRSAFAWEWLRRVHAYREAYEEAARCSSPREHEVLAARWGLHRFEAPDLPVPVARPLWRRNRFRHVLEAVAEEAVLASDRFDLRQFEPLATLHRASSGEEHLLISDGLRGIRLDVVDGSLEAGPVLLRYRLAGFASVAGPLLVLQRLLAFNRTGRFAPALHKPEVRATRWVAMLRTYDAMAAGATQRDIAEALISRDAAAGRWRVAAPTVRSRAQRLVRAARRMAGDGYLSLLDGS
jgi:hypothetical protein